MVSINSHIPSTLDINVFKAYCNYLNPPTDFSKSLNALQLDWEVNQPKTLRILALDEIIKKWEYDPKFFKLNNKEDKNYLLENLNTNLPLKILTNHIQDDVFWKRCFRNRWRHFYPNKKKGQSWISLYTEKHLAEYLENLDPIDYDQEAVQSILDMCSPYVVRLDINYLQPTIGERSDHIPFDYILANLTELKYIRITFDTKTIATNYNLGCCSPSKQDMSYLCRGLKKCYDLVEYEMHSTKMDPPMLKNLARCLEKGSSNLITLSLPHCVIRDAGLNNFYSSLSKESFLSLQYLNLTNNLLSQEAALTLSRTIVHRKLKVLILRLNPLGSDGAAAIFSIVKYLPLEVLDVSACSITDTISRILLTIICESKTLLHLGISNNELGNEIGKNLYRVIGFNKKLQYLDLRNTGISNEYKNLVYDIVFENRDKL